MNDMLEIIMLFALVTVVATVGFAMGWISYAWHREAERELGQDEFRQLTVEQISSSRD